MPRLLLLALGLLAATPVALAQGSLDCQRAHGEGLDPEGMSLAEALGAAERGDLDGLHLLRTLAHAEYLRDPAHLPALKRIVDAYWCNQGVVESAMLAIEAAGEPDAYFLDCIGDWARREEHAIAAAFVLTVRPEPSYLDEIRAVVDEAPDYGPRDSPLFTMARNYEAIHRPPGPYGDGDIRRAAFATMGFVDADWFFDIDGHLQPFEWYPPPPIGASARRALYAMARAYPSRVPEALDLAADSLALVLSERRDHGGGTFPTPAQIAEMVAVARQVADAVAFPSTAPPVPPADAGARVEPRLVCVEDAAPGLAPAYDYAARFAFDTPGPPVRVPYGVGNAVSGGSGGYRGQPEVFYTAEAASAWGGRALEFRVGFAAGEAVSWTLLGRTVTASAWSPRCGQPPPPPTCDG